MKQAFLFGLRLLIRNDRVHNRLRSLCDRGQQFMNNDIKPQLKTQAGYALFNYRHKLTYVFRLFASVP
jgi:hypothetical protein